MRNAAATLLFSILFFGAGPGFGQAPDWVNVTLSTAGRSSGHAGIGNDGTIGWVEINAGMAQVFRRDLQGQTTMVVEHVGTMGDIGWPGIHLAISATGVVVLYYRDGITNRWYKYANDVLANFDSGTNFALVTDSNKVIDKAFSGNGFGNLVEFDFNTGTRTVFPFANTFSNVNPKATNAGGLVVLQAQGRDPLDSGLYRWQNTLLTLEPLVGLPAGYTADPGASAADTKGSKFAYMYQAINGPAENQRVVVVIDRVSWLSSNISFPDEGVDFDISVDSFGRVIFERRVFDPLRLQFGAFVQKLFVFDGAVEREIASELFINTMPNVNEFGQVVYSRFPDSCGLIDPSNPSCKSDVFYYDLDSDEEKQVTDVPLGTYVWNAQINNAGDIAYMFAGKPRAASNNDNDSSFSVGAAIIDLIAPTSPTNLIAMPVSQSQINLSWTPSTDAVGLDGYDVFRNNVLITTTTLAAFQDVGLASNTAYTYAVVAFDLADNSSAASSPATASTLAPPPPPPPPPPSSGGGGSLGVLMLLYLFLIGGATLGRRKNRNLRLDRLAH